MRVVGLLHPGEMGASIGAALRRAGVQVLWASVGRGAATRRRAQEADLTDVGTLPELVARSQVVVSVCPPHAAAEVARTVATLGFGGIYVDANAVAPATARALGAVVEQAGGRFVDGDLIGGPVRPGGATRLYLSGPAAREVAALFAPTDLEAVALAGDVAAASALKMCYAAWTKGTSALLLAIRSAAGANGVEAALLEEWARTQPGLAARSQAAAGTARKAWRFAGELYRRLAPFKDVEGDPPLGEVLGRVRAPGETATDAPASPSRGRPSSTVHPMSIEVEAVRQVTDELLDACRRLLPQLSSSAAPLEAHDLARIANHQANTLLVARNQGAIVGMLTLVTFPLPSGLRARIEDVVVDQDTRGQGVGTALTKAAIDLAQRQGVRSLDLTSRASRLAANRLYQHLGFQLRDSNVYRYQPRPSAP